MNINKYFSFVKFSHSLFAMPFALIGFFLGLKNTGYVFDWKIFILVVLCMIFARNAAMGFNRFLDSEIDLKNERTKGRELPSGKISKKNALIFIIINAILFCISAYFINYLTFYLSPIALAVILGYSYTKKFTSLCHFVLGIGLALAPIGAYISVTTQFAILPILISILVLFWVSGFDILYALQDEEFDKKENLKSIPALLGRKNAMQLSILLHFLVIILLVFIGIYGRFGIFFWIAAAIFAIMLIYQHFIIKPNDLSKLNLAFFTTNGFASLFFGAGVIADILIR